MSVTTTGRPAPRKRQRGRETSLDMLRSLGVILLIVLPVWLLYLAPWTDDKAVTSAVRVIDPSSDIAAFSRSAPGVPVPGSVPAGWQVNVSVPAAGTLRVGYVAPGSTYLEYAAATGPAAPFLADITGGGHEVGTLRVEGVVWRQFGDSAGHVTLVQQGAGGTVAVGGVRETTTLEQLRVLAATVR